MITTKRDRQTEIGGISSEKRGAQAQPCDTDGLESDVCLLLAIDGDSRRTAGLVPFRVPL
jgi:hypothetical protein